MCTAMVYMIRTKKSGEIRQERMVLVPPYCSHSTVSHPNCSAACRTIPSCSPVCPQSVGPAWLLFQSSGPLEVPSARIGSGLVRPPCCDQRTRLLQVQTTSAAIDLPPLYEVSTGSKAGFMKHFLALFSDVGKFCGALQKSKTVPAH